MKSKDNSKSKNTSSNSGLWVGLLAVVVVAGMLWFSLRDTNGPAGGTSVAQAQTLSPDLFTGKVREAYQAAIDAPEVLEQMPCYCGCMIHNGHENNLDCFMDHHGAT